MKKNWKKGALHIHTIWSDGNALPEIVINTYKNKGYDFVCLSDHNVFQEDEHAWIQVVKENVWPGSYYRDVFEDDMKLALPAPIDKKQLGLRTFVRMKTYKELKKEWEIPGKFLVVPGNEISIPIQNYGKEERGYYLHYNLFNIAANVPVPQHGSLEELTGEVIEIFNKHNNNNGSFLMLNHPFWRSWDVDPFILINHAEIKLFEICNSGSSYVPENWICSPDKYYDFVLAHRLTAGNGLVYVTATDDSHYFRPDQYNTILSPNKSWVVVNCRNEFTAENITKSMLEGDFYASCGVMLEDVSFENGTLNVKVEAEEGVNYRIDFISTKKDFDRSIEYKEYTLERSELNREFPLIREDIGIIVKSVSGTSASCKITDDDLYIRAVITANKKVRVSQNLYPTYQCAWTQPFILNGSEPNIN